MIRRIIQIYLFSVIQYLLLFLIWQLTFLTNFQLHPLAFLISCGLKFKNLFSMSFNNKGFNFTSLRRMRFMNRGVKSSNLKQTTKELNFIVTKTKLQLLLQIETIITNYSKRLPLLSVISLRPRNCFKTCVKEKDFSPRHRESAMCCLYRYQMMYTLIWSHRSCSRVFNIYSHLAWTEVN